jgi:hypothetical protein
MSIVELRPGYNDLVRQHTPGMIYLPILLECMRVDPVSGKREWPSLRLKPKVKCNKEWEYNFQTFSIELSHSWGFTVTIHVPSMKAGGPVLAVVLSAGSPEIHTHQDEVTEKDLSNQSDFYRRVIYALLKDWLGENEELEEYKP